MASVGEIIRKKRENLHLTLSDAADATNISINFLSAIEGNDFSVLPRGVFPKMFIKAYANYLGLDADELVRLYYEQVAAAEEAVPEPLKLAIGKDRPLRRRKSRAPILIFLLIVAVMGVSAYFLFFRPGREWNRSDNGSHGDVFTKGAEAPKSTTGGNHPVSPGTAGGAAQYPAGKVEVRIEAKENCWVSLKWGENDRLEFIIKTGETFERVFAEQVNLKLGNAGGVMMSLNGRQTKSLGLPGEVVSITFGPDSYTHLFEEPAS